MVTVLLTKAGSTLLGGGFSVSSLPPHALSTIAAAVTVATVRSGHAIPEAMRAAGQTLIADVIVTASIIFKLLYVQRPAFLR
jgi:hypothetical protein